MREQKTIDEIHQQLLIRFAPLEQTISRRVSTASWQQTRQGHQGQLNRFRFRHRPTEYLASLETRWGQTFCV